MSGEILEHIVRAIAHARAMHPGDDTIELARRVGEHLGCEVTEAQVANVLAHLRDQRVTGVA